MINIKYDNINSSLYVKLTQSTIEDSEEIKNGFIIDFDENEAIVGFEILDLKNKYNIQIPIENILGGFGLNIIYLMNKDTPLFWKSCQCNKTNSATLSLNMI